MLVAADFLTGRTCRANFCYALTGEIKVIKNSQVISEGEYDAKIRAVRNCCKPTVLVSTTSMLTGDHDFSCNSAPRL